MESLKQRLANGSSDAFAELYDTLADPVFHYLVTQTGSREDAADVLQESFVRLYRARARLANVQNLSAYVFRVAHNEAVRWRRRNKPKTANAVLLFEETGRSDESTLETTELVAMAMNQLAENYREVIELRIFAKLTFAEVSKVLGKPQGTVATWYRRALEQMRNSLNGEVDR